MDENKNKLEVIQMNGRKTDHKEEMVEKSDDRFPRSIPFIIGNEFCERFCYYGMRAILTLYFVNVLKYTEDQATEGFHLFAMSAYFTPLFGAFIADSYLGKYLTILYLSIVYVFGNILLSYSSYTENKYTTILSLGLIALGTGGIKPCVSAFGGDQFKKNQNHLLEKFFSLFYLSINLGSLVSMVVTPIFRNDITCFGRDSCYPLAFGVPALLMIIALILFLIGTPLYVRLPASKGNVVAEFLSCLIFATYKKLTNLFSSNKPQHFLEYSASKYSRNLIEDSKSVLSCFLLLIPIPIFWSLFDQQGSKWVLQAQHTNGEISVFGWSYELKADQFQVINPLMIVFMIPLFDYVIYPVFNKIKFCTRPLQKMSLGGLIAAVAFVCSGLLQIHIDSSKITTPTVGQTNVNLIILTPMALESFFLRSKANGIVKENYNLENKKKFIDFGTIPAGHYDLDVLFEDKKNYTVNLILKSQECYSIVIYEKDGQLMHRLDYNEIKPALGQTQLKIYLNQEKHFNSSGTPYKFIYFKEGVKIKSDYELNFYDKIIYFSPMFNLSNLSGGYGVLIDKESVYNFTGKADIAYKLVILAKENGSFDVELYEWINFKRVSMFWQFIQYVVITAAEIMFSITGLSFFYAEAPASMKSVVSAAWLFTTALGNFFVVVITSIVHFESQAMGFFFYAFLMVLDVLIFMLLAYLYKPRKDEVRNEDKEVLELRNGTENNSF